MKKLLLVCFLLSSNFLFAQVQLDSVVITDTYSSEVLITYAYNYDSQGLLSGFTEAEEELKVEVINNSNDDLDQFIISDYYSGDVQTIMQYRYNDQQQMDSVEYLDPETLVAFQIYEILYSDGQVAEVICYNQGPDDSYDIYTSYLYYYENNIKIKREEYYFDSNEIPSLVKYEDYLYENGQLIKTLYHNVNDPDDFSYDSLKYNATGSIEKYMEVITFSIDPEVIDTITTKFEHEAGVGINSVNFPNRFFDVIPLLGFDDYKIIRLALMGEKPNTAEIFLEDQEYNFFYSVFVGLDERKPAKPISIYPNPVGDYLVIKDLDQIKTFDIYSISGEKLYSGNSSVVDSQDQKFLVNHLAAGMYTVVISTMNEEYFFATMIKE